MLPSVEIKPPSVYNHELDIPHKKAKGFGKKVGGMQIKKGVTRKVKDSDRDKLSEKPKKKKLKPINKK
jgi:hypothetical protein